MFHNKPPNSNGLMSLEARSYSLFQEKYRDGEFGTQRFGQAFYNHFDLAKMADQTLVGLLYEKTGAEARALVMEIFNLT